MQNFKNELLKLGIINTGVHKDSEANHVLMAQGNYFVAEFMHESDAHLISKIINELTDERN